MSLMSIDYDYKIFISSSGQKEILTTLPFFEYAFALIHKEKKKNFIFLCLRKAAIPKEIWGQLQKIFLLQDDCEVFQLNLILKQHILLRY